MYSLIVIVAKRSAKAKWIHGCKGTPHHGKWMHGCFVYFSSENIQCGNKWDSYATTHPAFALPSSRYASLFPEYSFAFCGDTGQGDAALAARMTKVRGEMQERERERIIAHHILRM